MKRLGMVFIFGLLSAYCFAQSQTGNASYNASKSGLTISHPSISFGTRVRIINLGNNSEVIATVNGRNLPDASCIADISREAGDAIGMSRSGYTRVRIEELPPERAAATPATEAPPALAPPPPPAEQAPPAPQAYPPASREEIYVTVPQTQYIPAPVVERVQNCPLSPALLVLLAIAVALLAAILVLLIHARRSLWWPGYLWWFGRYPLWARRRVRYLKKRRI
jgi:hypothetical protein